MLDIAKQYELLTKLLIEKKLTITTMESCTAGQPQGYYNYDCKAVILIGEPLYRRID